MKHVSGLSLLSKAALIMLVALFVAAGTAQGAGSPCNANGNGKGGAAGNCNKATPTPTPTDTPIPSDTPYPTDIPYTTVPSGDAITLFSTPTDTSSGTGSSAPQPSSTIAIENFAFVIEGFDGTPGRTAVFVVWSTPNVPSTSQVLYGVTPALGSASAMNQTLTVDHSMVISGLLTQTTYYFQAVSVDGQGRMAYSDIIFRTTLAAPLPTPTPILATPTPTPVVVTHASALFDYNGGDAVFVVPNGVSQISVKMWGAGGEWGDADLGNLPCEYQPGGGAGFVSGVLNVTAGDRLVIRVGGAPVGLMTAAGWPNGGAGVRDSLNFYVEGGGGGSSSILRNGAVLAEAAGGSGGKGCEATHAGGGVRNCGGVVLAGAGGGYCPGTESYGASSFVPAGGVEMAGSEYTPGNNNDPDRAGAGKGGQGGSAATHGRVLISY